jgi:hypothetical protein
MITTDVICSDRVLLELVTLMRKNIGLILSSLLRSMS